MPNHVCVWTDVSRSFLWTKNTAELKMINLAYGMYMKLWKIICSLNNEQRILQTVFYTGNNTDEWIL